ncbi:2Fe-2S iron-sulfur cluster-binding protein [Saccharomonospora viridis]|jgi:2Fe-2S ferredoxin|uniref:2Fe-2S iron-sulfur cluster-binding protein n=1 Tax=Saccharomonospora viridis TaxID=1852 RepID=UPI0023F2137E|nr:2Fe-2S iron-sulfur cluster-binding protein [Saccharomonospora viridis]
MPRVTYIVDGVKQTVEGATGDSVMITAVQNGLDGIVAECGGSCSCATCHVYVDEAWIERTGRATEEESELLEGAMSPPRPTSRLSCQIELSDELDGLVVEVAPEQ